MSVLDKMGIVTEAVEVDGTDPEWMNRLEMAIDIAESQVFHIFALGAAYWIAARVAHRTQLAASLLSPSPPEPPRLQRFRRMFALLFIAALFYFEFTVIRDIGQGGGKYDWQKIESVFQVVFGFLIFQQAAWVLSSTTVPLFTSHIFWQVVRAPTGVVMGRIDKSKGSRAGRLLNTFAIVGAAGAYTYFAFREDATDFIKIMAPIACLTTIGAKPMGRKMSVRWAIIGLLIFEACVLASSFIGAVVALLYISRNEGKLGKSNPSSSPSSDDNASSDAQMTLTNLTPFASVLPAVYAAGNAFLIVLCYRFDYHLFRLRKGESFVPVALEAKVSPTDGRIVAVGVPKTAPSWFRKPYFMTSLLLTLASHLAAPVLLHLLASTLSPDDAKEILSSPTKELTAGWMGLFIAGPVAGAGVVLVALIRREGKEMWKYEEVWVRRESADKAGPIRLEEASEEEDVSAPPPAFEESLEPAPAYAEKDNLLVAPPSA